MLMERFSDIEKFQSFFGMKIRPNKFVESGFRQFFKFSSLCIIIINESRKIQHLKKLNGLSLRSVTCEVAR